VHDPVVVDPAAVPDLGTEPLPGVLLDWRWSDRQRGQWRALVLVLTPQHLRFERWIAGEHLRRLSPTNSPE